MLYGLGLGRRHSDGRERGRIRDYSSCSSGASRRRDGEEGTALLLEKGAGSEREHLHVMCIVYT